MEIRVSDIKQFVYCPRVIYYTYVEPVPRKTTYKMALARESHRALNRKEERRTLKRYGLIKGKRHFGYPVYSRKYQFGGKIDILIENERATGQKFYPVECKDTDRGIYSNSIYQLVAYALALEEMTGTEVKKGYIYLINEDKAYEIDISDNRRKYVTHMLTMIRRIVQDEHYPEPRSRKRCWDCEFRRYCNDLDLPDQSERREKNIRKVQEFFGFHSG